MKNTAVCSPWQEAQDIVENIQTPVIPERQFCLKAVSGSEIRAALQNLLDECSESGGGKVVVPRGVYRCDGPLKLKSFTELHFEDGAVIKFSPHPEHYLPQVFTRWEGVEIYNYSPMIYGRDLTDVALTGNGTLVCGGEFFTLWRPLQKAAQKRTHARCPADGEHHTKHKGREKGILSGANVIMPNITPEDMRKKYLLYNNKYNGSLKENILRSPLQQQMQDIGYEIVIDRGYYR